MEQNYFNQRHFPGLEKQDLSLSINAMRKNHGGHHALSTKVSIESCCLFNPAVTYIGVSDGPLGLKVQGPWHNTEVKSSSLMQSCGDTTL